MPFAPARRTLIKTLGIGLASFGLGSPSRAAPVGKPLIEPGAGQLQTLSVALATVLRRRDFKSVPMVLTTPDQWDAEAIALVLGSKAEPRQAWNNTEIGGYWLTVMRNALNTQIWGFQHSDFLVVSATHGSAGFALYDQATWDKYAIGSLFAGKFDDKFKTNALMVEKTARDPRDFEDPSGLYSSADDSIPTLQRRGVVFMACHNAIWEHAAILMKRDQNPDKLDQGTLAAELTNHLVAGTILTPGIVGTLVELQKAGFFYASI